MKLLWLTWKDLKNPLAGGAEVVNEELARRLAAAGHDVTLLVGGFTGALATETVNGYRIIRVGNRLTVYWEAWRYYRRHFKGRFDLVIDEINTMPFFAKFYVKEPNLLFVHMLCREIWFYQLPKPLGLIGYLLEPLYLRLLSDRRVLTISASTKTDLRRHGFKPDNIAVISEGIELTPVADVQAITKYPAPTLLSLGSLRAMKRTLHQVKAFELAKRSLPNLKLKIAGDASDPYGQKVLRYIAKSPYRQDIEYLGRVSPEHKAELMQRSHLILVTSVKEGWGLIVTEAASQGTPAAVYDVDGLRDSVQPDVTGIIAPRPTPASLAAAVVGVLQDPAAYDQMRIEAHRHSQTVTFEQAYQDFVAAVEPQLPT
ncbi:MAG: glycosyltransferase family 4 protein [Candidatus Saccharimonadales bacterium]